MKLFFEKSDFDEVKSCRRMPLEEKLSLMADMVRLNAMNAIMCAKSGHLGASFSAAEVLTVLYHAFMRVDPSQPGMRERDIFILSKGHAAAALYSVLASCGFFPTERLQTFRRLGGLEGHAERAVPGVETNTGSLGMGISKAKGLAWAARRDGMKKSIFVLVGDGELQEGQNWEAIQSAAHWRLDNLYLLVDRNRVQTDMLVEKVIDIGPIEKKLKSFGWQVVGVNGHNPAKILNALRKLEGIRGKPKAIILNTIKGKGVSFMEHPQALRSGKGFYRWHDGLPFGEDYRRAWEEIIGRIGRRLEKYRVSLRFPVFQPELGGRPGPRGESLLKVFSEVLLEVAARRKDLVVLDADLAESCGLREFQLKYPDRFIEVGIAEQDMVSMAGGLALAGKLPVVNTYAAFLTSRANEQIFNNCSEGSKVIYVGHLAGILPAKPGKSHQGVRDISLLRSIPNILLCAPSCEGELRQIFELLAFRHDEPSYIRLEHNPSRVQVPWEGEELKVGVGRVLKYGEEAVAIGYGPTMLSEALLASEKLEEEKIGLEIIDLPWLNRIDEKWLRREVAGFDIVVCLENHSVKGGLADEIARIVGKVHVIGLEGYGRSGEATEVLAHFGMDCDSIARKVRELVRE
jgi:transketolase